MRKLISLLSISATCVFSVSAVHAQSAETFPLDSGYLSNTVKKDPVLAVEFTKITQPLVIHFPWVAKYGTSTPAEMIIVEGKEYAVYQGCKPHQCNMESYAVIYSPLDKKIVAGAFVQNKYEQNNFLVESKVSWLSQGSTDFAVVLGKYLF